VQFVLLTEATRGGVRRGFAAMAGANGMFGVLLLSLAAGLALVAPGPAPLRALKIVGGAFLLFLAGDALIATWRGLDDDPSGHRGRTPFLRGVFAVLLNPGAWVFLATTASALFASAVDSGGRPLSLLAAVAMLAGVSVIDGSMVLLGGGVRRFEDRVARWLTPVLALGLAVFGAILVIDGIRG
jgi:threonine/homoserine/homoserine lactone efflux protein